MKDTKMRTNINSKRSQNQNACKGEERNINKGQGGYTGGTVHGHLAATVAL